MISFRAARWWFRDRPFRRCAGRDSVSHRAREKDGVHAKRWSLRQRRTDISQARLFVIADLAAIVGSMFLALDERSRARSW